MKRVRSFDDDDITLSCNGGIVHVSRTLVIQYSATIANFLQDVPDATDFVVPECAIETLRWITTAMEKYPQLVGDPTNIFNAVCVANYLEAEKMLTIAIDRLYWTGAWRSEAAKSIPTVVLLHKLYPRVSSFALIEIRKTDPLAKTYILRKAKEKFAFPANTDDETYIEAWKELKERHPIYHRSDYFLGKVAAAKAAEGDICIITAAVEKYGSYAAIYALRLKRDQMVQTRLEYERALVFQSGYRDVKFSEPLRIGKSDTRWRNATKSSILKHAEKVAEFMEKKNFSSVYKMVTDQKFKDLINETF